MEKRVDILERLLLGLILLLFLSSLAPAQQLRKVSLSLKASVRSFTIDADIRAGGELLVRREAGEDGNLRYVLVRPLVHPWKFYWVDPAGPFGEKVWGGTMSTLPEYSPGVRQSVDSAAYAFIKKIWKQWKQEGGDHRLNGNDSFYVFLPPEGRLRFSVTPDGRQTGPILNLLTHNWIPDGVARWENGQAEAGFSFGEEFDEPPSTYEPHTYHALIDALQLLSRSLMKGDSAEVTAGLGAGGTYPVVLGDTPEEVFGVLKTLIPMIGEDVSPRQDVVLGHRVEQLDDSSMLLSADTGSGDVNFGDGIKGRVTRRARFDRTSGTVVSDRLSVRFRQDGSTKTRLELSIGYGPVSSP